VNQVNAESFAGHADWRLATMAGTSLDPTGEAAELESIADPGFIPPIDPIFGPTATDLYWSGSSGGGGSNRAWAGPFGSLTPKENPFFVRAVRTIP
jgi:hypothetical protein